MQEYTGIHYRNFLLLDCMIKKYNFHINAIVLVLSLFDHRVEGLETVHMIHRLARQLRCVNLLVVRQLYF